MMTWVICGAGRGVGKTHLARGLCEILPNAASAKCGHGEEKPDGPGNYFTTQDKLSAFIEACRDSCDHVVVESNAMARGGTGDVIIFVDEIPGVTDVRDDVATLRANSHVAVGAGGSVRDWKKALRRRVPDRRLLEAVCDVLAEQKRHLSGASCAVRSKVWFTVGDMHVFGSGLAGLLENISRSGTLSRAAEDSGMSYRHAWNLLKNAEKHLGKRLILPQAGGVGGGRTSLSDEGRRLLEVFKRLNSEVAAFADSRFAALYGDGASDDENA